MFLTKKKFNGHFFFAGLGEATLQTVWPDDLEDDDVDAEDGLNPGPFWHRAEVEGGSGSVWSSAAAKVSAEDMDDPSKEIAIVIDAADDDDDVDKSGAKKLRRRVTTEDLYCDDEFQETNLVNCYLSSNETDPEFSSSEPEVITIKLKPNRNDIKVFSLLT